MKFSDWLLEEVSVPRLLLFILFAPLVLRFIFGVDNIFALYRLLHGG